MNLICSHHQISRCLLVLVFNFISVVTAFGKGQPDFIGIDLGTSFTRVGVFVDGQVKILTNEQGNRLTPSVVSFHPETGHRVIGEMAKRQLTLNPQHSIYNVKRLMGREWEDPILQDDIKKLTYKVVQSNSKPYIKIQTEAWDAIFSPEQISAMLIGRMKQIAEAHLRTSITNVVISVPAYFNEAQRQATKDAGEIAGLTILRLISEPTAGAIGFGLVTSSIPKLAGIQMGTYLVIDLGGGTLDVSLMSRDDNTFHVIATSGNTHLGSEDFSQRVVDHFLKLFEAQTGLDPQTDLRAVQKLRREVERAQIVLSVRTPMTEISIDSFFGGKPFVEEFTLSQFHKLNKDLFLETVNLVSRVLKDGGMDKSEVEKIILVGGPSRIPMIQQIIRNFFDGKKEPLQGDYEGVVAMGSAIQAAILMGESMTSNVLLIDVNPISLGIQIIGGVMSTIIDRNTIVPNNKWEFFTTTEDDQDAVSILVYEGEENKTTDNHFLGLFTLTDIRKAAKGVVQIKITFHMDADGILHVTAEEVGLMRNQKEIILKTSYRGRHEINEIDRMMRAAHTLEKMDEVAVHAEKMLEELEEFVYPFSHRILNDGNDGVEKREIVDDIDFVIEYLEILSSNGVKPDIYENMKRHLEDAETRYKSLIQKRKNVEQ